MRNYEKGNVSVNSDGMSFRNFFLRSIQSRIEFQNLILINTKSPIIKTKLMQYIHEFKVYGISSTCA